MHQAMLEALWKHATELTREEMVRAAVAYLPLDLFPGGEKTVGFLKQSC